MTAAYSERLSLEAAWSWVDTTPQPAAIEAAPLAEAAGRVLAENLIFDRDRPPRDIALIDGYAVQADSVLGAGNYNPLYLALSSERNAVTAATAAPCCAGQALPSGADSILPFSVAEPLGAVLEIAEGVPRGAGAARRGEAAVAGETALVAGTRLGPAQIAVAASVGRASLSLFRRPVVALWLPGAKDDGAESLALALSALIARDGGAARLWGGDARPDGADAVLFVGRSGWGVDDDAAARLEALGGAIVHRGLALSPGDATGLGHLGAAPVLLVPGDPFAALAVYEILAGRLIRRLAHRPAPFAGPPRRAALSRKIASPVGVAEFAPVVWAGGLAAPLAPSPSDGLAALAKANGFVLIPAGSEGFAEGSEVEVVLLESGGTS